MIANTRHIDDGLLRRLCDEPLALSGTEHAHLTSCRECRDRLDTMQRSVDEMALLLGADAPVVDAGAALVAVRGRLAETGTTPRSRGMAGAGRWIHGRITAVTGMAAAAALLAGLTLTPAGSWAQSVLTVFQPQQVSTISVTAADLRTLPKLWKYGTIHVTRGSQPTTTTDLTAAEAAAGMHVDTPASLPSSVPSQVTFQVVPGQSATFTFSAAKAARVAARTGKPAPPMPSDIDGSTLQLTTGNAVLAVYGPTNGIPTLVIGETKAPVVTSSGVTVQQLENYVLSLPGVSPQLAAEIKAIGDPTSTLPLPIPVNLAHAQNVTVQGVHGVAVGDNTGMGSVVIWEKDGIIHGVGGTLTQDQVMAIAESLH